MLQGMFEFESQMPAWLRPTYRGAFFILGMSFGWPGKLLVLTILATLMLMAGAAPGSGLFVGLLGIAVMAGAVSGTIHGVLHPLDHWGRFGAWLRWTLTIFGYVVAFGSLMWWGPFSVGDPGLYAVAAGISTLGAGCLMLLDERRPSRPTPRRLRLLQDRERMWAAADRVRAGMQSRRPNPGDPGERATFAPSTEGLRARRSVNEEWLATIRRSSSRLGWWTRE